MERITSKEQDINSPELYDSKFCGTLGVFDMERHEKLAKHFKEGIYVDIGCFDSIMPILLAERFPKAKVWALDYAPKLIAFLGERFPKVRYTVHDIRTGLPFEDNSVDHVTAGEVIEHLEDPAAFVKEALRILKPGGYLAISTPHEEVNREHGGCAHLWRWTVASVEELLGTKDTEVIQEGPRNRTILAWRKK